jgi:dTDP-4-amino-4,6-dideoxygalactose transaminase
MSTSPSQQTEQISLPSDQVAEGRTLGKEEIALLSRVIESGTLTSTKGQFVKQLEADFAERMGAQFCHASASGSAALHTAFAAIDPEPGDEFITTPITDMGALTPILYQGAVPVFSDVDYRTCNMTADTIEARLSERTKAIVVTHLFGNPCDMGPIMELARSKNIPVIEDCAQAFDATYRDEKVGVIGDIGCFSMQQGKHITTGEGGLCVTNDKELSRRMFLFINKAWGYGDPKPDHYFLAPNYRMNELTGAVAVAQLKKLHFSVTQRQDMADLFTSKISDIDGIATPAILPDATHTYWKYCLTVDLDVVQGGAVGLAAALKEHGIFSAPRYIQKPAFACQVFSEQRTFGNSRFPFTLARPEAVDYNHDLFPGTYEGLERILVLPWNERYTESHVCYLADCLRRCVESNLVKDGGAA